ncbi:MAG: response regulator transcription factor [Methylobacter sp.]
MECNTPAAWIYLVDDEFAVRDSLTLLIQSTGRPIKSFDSAEAFLSDYDPGQPGCLILDVRMPYMNGLELQEELSRRNIHIPIIFISGNAEIPDSAKAFRAGAVDFLEKPFNYETLLERIDEAIKKDLEARSQLVEKQRMLECFNSLTAREKEVLQLIISSYSNKEAAKILDVSHRTIDAHRARIMEKMQADNIAALVAMVMNHALLNTMSGTEKVH